MPAEKTAEALPPGLQIGEQKNMLFTSTIM